ncbi:40S ribosomal protein S15 [Zea mays]|uniref:40S ribosomal protein S15 n=1 Tax=Zea mays TaxID=4577 RepID=A0A3L6FU08_MAIZE|nr:40S ribosomal protein S15 [Zea mays]
MSILVQEMINLAIKYNKAVQEEDELPPEKLAIANVGRQDAKKHLEEHVSNLMSSNNVDTTIGSYVYRCLSLPKLMNKLIGNSKRYQYKKLLLKHCSINSMLRSASLALFIWLGKIILETCISHIAASAPKKTMFRKYSYRDIDLDALLNMSTDDLVQLFPVDAWRRFQRGLKRKPMEIIKKLCNAVSFQLLNFHYLLTSVC